MPIAQLNPDGSVKIYNSKTGETKDVRPDDLGQYNPKMIGEYYTLKTEADEKAKKSQEPLSETEGKFQIGLSAAEKALSQLDEGQQTGPIATRRQKFKENFGSTEGTQFRANVALANTAIKSAFLGAGQSGAELEGAKDFIINPNDQEAVVREKLLTAIPLIQDRLGVDAAKSVAETAASMETKPGPSGFSESDLVEGQDYTLQAVDTASTSKKKESNILKDVARTAGDVAPLVLGTVGGAGGAVAGAGVGSIATGAAGTAAGVAAGKAFQNSVENLLGEQDEPPLEQVANAASEAAIAGTLDAVTGGTLHIASKGAGVVIKSALKNLDDIPLKGLRINPSQLTNFNKKHSQDLAEFVVEKKLLGDNAIEIGAEKAAQLQADFDNLAMNENITIPVNNLKNNFARELRNLAGVTDDGVKNRVVPNINKTIAKKVLDEWDNISRQIDMMRVDNLSPAQITEFRRQLDQVIPDSQFIKPDVRNVALRVRQIMNDTVRDGVDARLIGEGSKGSLKNMGQELSKYYDFLSLAEKQANLGRGSMLFNIPKIGAVGIGATTGASVAGPAGSAVGAAAGLGAEAAMRDPAVLAAIYAGGKAGEGVLKNLDDPTVAAIRQALMQSTTSAGSAATADMVIE